MKKLLALLLTAVMLLGMISMVSAVDFTDAADIDRMNEEAVTVLSEMGIIGGMGDGTFQPNGTLTRAQAAKIIAYMKLGKAGAEALTADTAAFTDVPTSHWACKYVGYCAKEGIVSGVGNNKFNPNGTLTGFQFGKMVLVAIGFNPEIEGLTGSNWDINVNNLVREESLNRGVSVNSQGMRRQDACHLALNGLFYGEEKDPYNTLAYKAFTATRAFGGNDKEDYRRPYTTYTCETSDALWEGTELTVKASPYLIYEKAFTMGDLYKDLGNKTFTIESFYMWSNNISFNKAGATAEKFCPAQGSTTAFPLSGYGVTSEWYYDGTTPTNTCVQICMRGCQIVAVKDPSIASNGTVLEEGTVTVTCQGSEYTCPNTEFTSADIGSYVLADCFSTTSWKIVTSVPSVHRAKIVTGKFESESAVRVGGKTYNPIYGSIAGTSDLPCTAKAYIEAGGQVGDEVHVITDKLGNCYGIYQ